MRLVCFDNSLYSASGVCIRQFRSPIIFFASCTQLIIYRIFVQSALQLSKTMNTQPYFDKIFKSRNFSGILTILLNLTNCHISKSDLRTSIGAVCTKFLQNKRGNIFDVFLQKPIIIIIYSINKFNQSIPVLVLQPPAHSLRVPKL